MGVWALLPPFKQVILLDGLVVARCAEFAQRVYSGEQGDDTLGEGCPFIMYDIVLVVDAYYPDEEGHKVIKEKKVKFMLALNKQRFPVMCSLVKHGVEIRGKWNARWHEKRKDVLDHAMNNKDGKEFYTLSNAYKRQSTKGLQSKCR